MTTRVLREGLPDHSNVEAMKDWYSNHEVCDSRIIGESKGAQNAESHLVAIAEDTLIDMTLDQANAYEAKKKLGIALPAEPVLRRPLNHNFLKGAGQMTTEVTDCIVCYYAQPKNRSFEKYDDWNDHGKREKLRKQIIGKLDRKGKTDF